MTIVRRLTERADILPWLERDRRWAIYALGDLEPGMFEQCEWYAACDSLVLLFKGLGFVPLVTIGGSEGIAAVLEQAVELPRVYLNQRLEHLDAVLRFYACETPHAMQRMVLEDFRPARVPEGAQCLRLGMERLDDARALYEASGAGDAFAPYQLETGYFCGIEREGQLVSIAGVHLASRTYGVGPVGNVGTLPEFRGRGYGAAVTSAVVEALLADGIHTIGLNVEQSNRGAIRIYERLGFRTHCEFTEGVAWRR